MRGDAPGDARGSPPGDAPGDARDAERGARLCAGRCARRCAGMCGEMRPEMRRGLSTGRCAPRCARGSPAGDARGCARRCAPEMRPGLCAVPGARCPPVPPQRRINPFFGSGPACPPAPPRGWRWLKKGGGDVGTTPQTLPISVGKLRQGSPRCEAPHRVCCWLEGGNKGVCPPPRHVTGGGRGAWEDLSSCPTTQDHHGDMGCVGTPLLSASPGVASKRWGGSDPSPACADPFLGWGARLRAPPGAAAGVLDPGPSAGPGWGQRLEMLRAPAALRSLQVGGVKT